MKKESKNLKHSDLKTSQHWMHTILQYMQGKRYQPMTAKELFNKLNIPKHLHQLFLSSLDKLVSDGKLFCKNKRYQIKNFHCLIGTISVHPLKGFGFVKVEGQEKDIFIPRHFINDAINGDLVEVDLLQNTSKGWEGKVTTILKRSRTHVGCTIIDQKENDWIAYSQLLGLQKLVRIFPCKTKLEIGDRIISEVIEWNNEYQGIDAKFHSRIGNIQDASCDITAAIEEFELPHEFTIDAINEAKAFKKSVDINTRLDLTDLECITIDPDTAKDFDDAISLTRDEKGNFLLGVHIADAAAYVKTGSALDSNAFLRCNSTYFPGYCLPMLPEELSTNLCSLKPHVNRLTISVFIQFDESGNFIDYKIERSVIQSKKRFTYKEAFQILKKEKKSSFLPLLEQMVELCHLLKHQRLQRGSIDFAMTEKVVAVDPSGNPLRIDRIEYDITHQMIEEFMLKANEIVAIHLYKNGKELLYRIHDEPSSDSFEDFFNYARTLGFSLPTQPKSSDIQKLFEKAKDSPLAPQLSIQFIRSMKLAFYSLENIGHFGLALEHYCHFTSPIRRYSDLIIQRILFNEEDPKKDLVHIAEICSEKERISSKAEASVVQLKKIRLAIQYFAQDPNRCYGAIATRIKPYAIHFEVQDLDLEGSLHISELGNDYFLYDPKHMFMAGTRSGITYYSGSTFSVQIQNIDLTRRQIQWSIEESPQLVTKKK